MLEAIIIGAGHAGLSISYHLQQHHVSHLILERGEVGNSWRHQRWDALKLNTPNKLNGLPGMQTSSKPPDEFSTATEFAALLSNYATKFQLPVQEHTQVLQVANISGTTFFRVTTLQGSETIVYEARQVVVASGVQNAAYRPEMAGNLPVGITQLHSSEYRNGTALKHGAVLIIGSGQSGAQIASDLAGSGRKVFLSTSRVGWIPRSYMGVDIEDWLVRIGFYEDCAGQATDSLLSGSPQPLISNEEGVPPLTSLMRRGVTLTGTATYMNKTHAAFQDNTGQHIQFGCDYFEEIREMIHNHIRQYSLPYSFTTGVAALPALTEIPSIPLLDFAEQGISTIIWATGFTRNFGYVQLPVFQADGSIKHSNGITAVPGLYFVGLPWLRKRKSGIIWGIVEDAAFLKDKLINYAQNGAPA